jgi:hypothetical protein
MGRISSRLLQDFNLFLSQAIYPAERTGGNQDSSTMLETLHPDSRLTQIPAPGDRAVVRQKESSMSV